MKLTRNLDSKNYFYSGYCIRFDTSELFSLSDGSGLGENVIIFGVDSSSSVHAVIDISIS